LCWILSGKLCASPFAHVMHIVCRRHETPCFFLGVSSPLFSFWTASPSLPSVSSPRILMSLFVGKNHPASLARGSLRWSFPPRLAMAGAPCSWCSCLWLARNLANRRASATVDCNGPPCGSISLSLSSSPSLREDAADGGSTHTLHQPQLGNSSTLSRGSMNPSSPKIRYRYLHTCRVWRWMLRQGSLACIR
jgi:hypothetical protein